MACPGQNPAEVEPRSDVEVVRLRPGMFIGSPDARGLFELLFELVTYSLAEAVAGYGRSVRVTLRADGSAEVADDGRPPEDVERAFTTFTHGHHGYCPDEGRGDYGCVVANALSEWLRVVARTDGCTYQHTFRRGVTDAVVQTGGPPGDRGLTVAFRPDPEIFGGAQFDAGAVCDRLRQLAFLHSGVRITFADEAAGTRDEFEFADGIRECVRHLNASRVPLHPEVIVLRGEEQGVRYEVGLQWCAADEEVRWSFANHYRTTSGGTHDRGLAAGVAAALRDFIGKSRPGEFTSDDLRTGLTAVVSAWLAEPMFWGATRNQLSSPEAEAVVKVAVRRGVREYLEAHRDAAERIVDAVVEARDVRVVAADVRKRLRERLRKRGG